MRKTFMGRRANNPIILQKTENWCPLQHEKKACEEKGRMDQIISFLGLA